MRLVAIDGAGLVDENFFEFVVVYDPDGGFVTGGGKIESTEGAYSGDPTVTGTANFGFVSKYKKGSSVPEGNTNFKLKAGDLKFKAKEYSWLVVDADGERARFRGTGTVNGQDGFEFVITVIDAANSPDTSTDLFRIQIWNEADGTVVYDNEMGSPEGADPTTEISGGSIVIHASNKKGPK